MRRLVIVAALAVLGLVPAREAAAGGFMIYEHSALSTGMANARTALWDDSSSLFYNPSAITELPGFQISIGDSLIFPSVDYKPSLPRCESPTDTDCGVPDSTEFGVFYPVHIYFTAQVTKWLSLGISLNNPFGLGTFWPEDWDGRFTAWQTDLKTFFVQPTVAVNIARLAHMPQDFSLSLGAGGYFVHGIALIRSKVDGAEFNGGSPAEAEMKLEGDANSGGYHFSAFFAWKKWLSIGASVRSNVPLHFEGTARFSGPEEETWFQLMRDTLHLLPPKTTGRTRMELPWNMNFGVAFHGIPRTTIAFDLYVAMWESYDKLKLDFACDDLEMSDPGYCAPALGEAANYPKKWKTGYQFSLGVEVRPIAALALRLGYGYVTAAANPEYYDAMLPDGNRHLITFGVGYRAPRFFKVDVGYMLAMWEGTKDNEVGAEEETFNRNATANGKYESTAHILAITIGLSFGGPNKGKPMTLAYEPIVEEPAALPPPSTEPILAEPPPPAAEPVAPAGDASPAI